MPPDSRHYVRKALRAISSGVTTGDEANPHAPLTIARTPKPNVASSPTLGTERAGPPPRPDCTRRPMPITQSHDADIEIGRFIRPAFAQRDGAQFFEFGRWCFRVLRFAEKIRGEGSRRGGEEMAASEHNVVSLLKVLGRAARLQLKMCSNQAAVTFTSPIS